jgi:hypothetical protein
MTFAEASMLSVKARGWAGAPVLSEIDLERHISVPEAAELKGISPDTFKRHYGHLIHKVSPRRKTVKLRDALEK